MSSNNLFVFNTEKKLIGRISDTGSGFEFQYSKSYLSNPNALAVNPVKLPLSGQVYFSKNGFSDGLTTFLDSMPGAWGRAVLDASAGRKLDDFEILLQNQKDRVGNLIFSNEMSAPLVQGDYLREPFEWDDIIQAKEEFERTNRFSDKYDELFKQGASQGGARPKISILKDGEIYLAKLPTIRDYLNASQIEHGTLALARAVGINTVESEVINLKGVDIFLTKRFDYRSGSKLPYLSMQSVLGVEHSHEASYSAFSLELQRLNGAINSEEIFRRMAFNVLVSNHDDHYQNHAIYFDGLWQLTPAFDIVAGEGNRRTQAINIGKQGNLSTYENILSEAYCFGLSDEDARDILDSMIFIIQNDWKAVFQQAGVSSNVIESIEWAILFEPYFQNQDNPSESNSFAR